jgi:hypothetical protein
LVFIGIGVWIFVELAVSIGPRWQGLSGYALALAFIALGVLRLRAGWPRVPR